MKTEDLVRLLRAIGIDSAEHLVWALNVLDDERLLATIQAVKTALSSAETAPEARQALADAATEIAREMLRVENSLRGHVGYLSALLVRGIFTGLLFVLFKMWPPKSS